MGIIQQGAEAVRSEVPTSRGLAESSTSIRKTMANAAFEIGVNNMLAQSHTGIVNLLSNAAALAVKGPETGVRAVLSMGNKPESRTYYPEALAELTGLVSGIDKAVRYSGRRLMNGITRSNETVEESLSKVNSLKEIADVNDLYLKNRSITKENLGVEDIPLVGTLVDGLGSIINAPGTMLNHTDITFKMIHAEQAKEKMVINMVKSGKAKTPEEARQIINSSEDAQKSLINEAEYYTYQAHPKSKLFSWIMDSKLTEAPGVRWLIPFKRSIANIQEMGFEYSPLAFAVPELRRRILFGTEAEKAAARTKLITGSFMLGLLAYKLNDNLTGAAPRDPVQREMWQDTYGKEFTFKAGDQRVELDTLGPLGEMLKAVALYKQWAANESALDEGDHPMNKLETVQKYAQFVRPIMEVLTDDYWTHNLAEFYNDIDMALQEGNIKPLARWVERMGELTVPLAGARGVQRIVEDQDPTKKEYRDIGDQIKLMIPELRKNLHQSYSWDGSPMLVNRFQGFNTLPFIPNPYHKDDPIRDALMQYKVKFHKRQDFVRTPGIGGKPGVKVQMNRDEWDAFNALINKGLPDQGFPSIRDIMGSVIESRKFERLDNDDQRNIMLSLVRDRYFKQAKQIFLLTQPGLQERRKLAYINQLNWYNRKEQ